MTDTPINVSSMRTGDYTVQLSWSAPASDMPPIAGYEVFYAESGSSVTQSGGNTTNTTTTINVTLSTLNVMYDFFVVAFSVADNALPSQRSDNGSIYLSECFTPLRGCHSIIVLLIHFVCF